MIEYFGSLSSLLFDEFPSSIITSFCVVVFVTVANESVVFTCADVVLVADVVDVVLTVVVGVVVEVVVVDGFVTTISARGKLQVYQCYFDLLYVHFNE